MNKTKVISLVAICVILLQTGCYTNLYVNFGNGTGRAVCVKDTQSGKEVQIQPGKFRKIGHGQADIIVITPDKARYVFTGVKTADPAMDKRYFPPSSKGFLGLGTWSFDIRLLLQTNMVLYVLRHDQESIDTNVPQPDGYPKVGKEMAD